MSLFGGFVVRVGGFVLAFPLVLLVTRLVPMPAQIAHLLFVVSLFVSASMVSALGLCLIRLVLDARKPL